MGLQKPALRRWRCVLRRLLAENDTVPATGVGWGWWPGPTLSGVGALKESASSIRPKQSRANYTLVPNADAGDGFIRPCLCARSPSGSASRWPPVGHRRGVMRVCQTMVERPGWERHALGMRVDTHPLWVISRRTSECPLYPQKRTSDKISSNLPAVPPSARPGLRDRLPSAPGRRPSRVRQIR